MIAAALAPTDAAAPAAGTTLTRAGLLRTSLAAWVAPGFATGDWQPILPDQVELRGAALRVILDVPDWRLRIEGASWDTIAGVLGFTRWTVIERGRRIKAMRPQRDFLPPPEDPARDPLPAGYPLPAAAGA